MRWEVSLNGNNYDLNMLSKVLYDCDYRVTLQDNRYILSSSNWNRIDCLNNVKDLATKLVQYLNGMKRLLNYSNQPIVITEIVKIDSDGKRENLFELNISTGSRVDVELTTYNESGEEISYFSPLNGWLDLISKSNAVDKAFRLLSKQDIDWVDLYKIFEVIENDIQGTKEIEKRCWANNQAIRRFKHTANSPSAIGDSARHGKESTKPSPDPMPFEEAKALIVFIMQSWLEDKTT